jgi:hypothetical protein
MTSNGRSSFQSVAGLSIGMVLTLVGVADAAPERVLIKAPRLGVLNLIGAEADTLVADDLKAFTPLFGKAVESRSAAPKCDVLLVYARISDAGKVANSEQNLRGIIRDAGATVVIVASENSGDAYIAGSSKTGYGSANLVMTIDRGGKRFSAFFVRLFKKMFSGTTMPVAWVKLVPQVPGMDHPDAPGTIFAAEAGQVTFR